ncbi:hypothetical protein DFS34DRAFT_661976 [Phlyctochytrium arcticum]|nr:hypothetical protein DFS34DRAFT_661976 [Phlyctochytrium arcticum]
MSSYTLIPGWRTLLLTLAAALWAPSVVQAINVNMTIPRHDHEMFLLNNRLVVMGGAKYEGGAESVPVHLTDDTLCAQNRQCDELATKYLDACARWEGTPIVVCAGGLKPGRSSSSVLEVTTFSLAALQDWTGGTGTIDIGIKAQNSNTINSWFLCAVILGMATEPWPPYDRYWPCMVRINNTSFFIFGGRSNFNRTVYQHDDSWIYTAGSGWTAVPRPGTYPPPRHSAACTFFQGKVWAFGGQSETRAFNDIWSFDPNTKLWNQEVADSTRFDDGQPRAHHFGQMVGVGNHLIISPGLEFGAGLSTASDSSLYFFNIQSGKWVSSKAQLLEENIGGGGRPVQPPPPTSSGLSGGVIGGIAAAGVMFLAGLVLLLLRWRRNSALKCQQSDADVDVIEAGKTSTATSPSDSPLRVDSTATLNIEPHTQTPVPQQKMYNDIPVQHHSMAIDHHDSNLATFVPPTRTQDRVVVNIFDTDPIGDLPPSYNTLSTSAPTAGSSSSAVPAAAAHPTATRSIPTSPEKSSNPEIRPTDSRFSQGDKTGYPHVGIVPFRPGGRQELITGDEFMISPGDVVSVMEVYADGWAQGSNDTTNATGFFPYNCVRLA